MTLRQGIHSRNHPFPPSRRRWGFPLLGGFFCFLLLSAFAPAQEVLLRQMGDEKTDTHVEVLALFNKPSSAGYLPVRVKLANNLKSEKSVTLEFESKNNYYSGTQANSAFTFTAPAGKTVLTDILVPLAPISSTFGGASSVTVALTGAFGESSGSLNGAYEDNQPSVLLSDKLYTPNASTLDAETTTRFSHSGTTQFAGKFDPKQLPDNWLAFSGYDSILMTDADWTDIPPGGRNAILSWLRLGGRLEIFSSSAPSLASLGLPEDSSFGKIRINRITGVKLPPHDTVEAVFNDHDGRLPPKSSSLKGDFASWPLVTAFGGKEYRYALFMGVLLVFAILVGPINLFVFAKSGRRHRLFVTTPLISVGASLLLVVLIICQDGFGGNGQRMVLMEVRPDGDQNAAYVMQEQFSRTGVMTRASFTMDTPALFLPAPITPSRWARFTTDYDGAKGAFNLQPVGAKFNATGDWFQSRSEQGHYLMAVVPTRGRLEFAGSPDRMVSSFDYPLQTLFYQDPSGQWFRKDDIQTGKPFTLTPVDFTLIDPELDRLRNALTGRDASCLDAVKYRKGCFVAMTTAAPGIATHPGIRWRKTTTILTGPVVQP